MPAADKIHEMVKAALVKDGWTITHDPYILEESEEDVRLYIDLAAERLLAAERGSSRIAVEVKSFLGRSPVHDLEVALGQFNLYQVMLESADPGRKLFLAVSEQAYDHVFTKRFVQKIMERYRLALIVVRISHEEIAAWID